MREAAMVIFKEFRVCLLLDAAFMIVTVLLVITEGIAVGKVWRFFRRLMYVLLIGETVAFLPLALSGIMPNWTLSLLLGPSIFVFLFPFPPLFGGLVQPIPIITEVITAGVYAAGFKKMTAREKIGIPLLFAVFGIVRYMAFWELASGIAR